MKSELKLAYLAPASIPSKSANSIHVMKMCEALGAVVGELTLFIPSTRQNRKNVDIFEFYNVEQTFTVCYIELEKKRGHKFLYAFKVLLAIKRLRIEVVYSRDLYTTSLLALVGIKNVLEFHHYKESSSTILRFLSTRLKTTRNLPLFVSITDALKSQLVLHNFPAERIAILPDAASPPFSEEKLIGGENFKIGYVGHLYKGKGMEIISALLPHFPSCEFHVVGGRDEDIDVWKKSTHQFSNITFHGFVRQELISGYLNSFDCCLLPNQRSVFTSGGNNMDIGEVTSPLKMFEYMAHGKAIIASDLPNIREILNEKLAVLKDPDDIRGWKDGIQTLMNGPVERERIGRNARVEYDKKYSWNKRAKVIVSLLEKNL